MGDPIDFGGSATDAQDGTLPPSALSWSIVMHHCPSDCHSHTIQDIPGVSSGTFVAPDHEYPSYLELRLTATDSGGLTDVQSVRLDPRTADLSVASSPSGLSLTPEQRDRDDTVHPHGDRRTRRTPSRAPLSQSFGGKTYGFDAWSDDGAASHTITATGSATYTASYSER